MSTPSPQDVQALIDQGTTALSRVTGKYNPAGKNWSAALSSFAAARAEAGQLVAPSPPPPPAGNVLFDGRASQMVSIDSYGVGGSPPPAGSFNVGPTNVDGPNTGYFFTSQQWKDPNRTHNGSSLVIPELDQFACVCYGRGKGHNFQIVTDPHYGPVFRVTATTGDTNQWGGSDAIDGAAECSVRHTQHTDGWMWYAMAAKLDAWQGAVSDIRFMEIMSLCYQTSASSQVALGATYDQPTGKQRWSIFQNAGYGNNPTGWAQGSVSYTQTFLDVVYGQWVEFVVGVKASTGDDGEVQVYSRPPSGSWAQVFDHQGATAFYGNAAGQIFPQNIEGQGVTDKMGLYFGTHDNAVVTQTVTETGYVVCGDLASAQGTFPS